MRQLKGVDLKRACLVPSSVFASPDEVVRAPGLSPAQKLTILRRWEFDARKVSGFARGSEAAVGGATMLFQIQRALDALSGRAPAAQPTFAGRPGERPAGRGRAATDPDPREIPPTAPPTGAALRSGGRGFSGI